MRTTTRRTDGNRRPPRRAFRWFPGRRDHDRGHRCTPVVGRLGRTRNARDLRANRDISASAGQRGRGRGLRPRRAGAGERHGTRADARAAELRAATSLVCRPALSVDQPCLSTSLVCRPAWVWRPETVATCLLYTSDAADEEDSVDLGGRRIIKKKK